jgi:hypothetical protein
MMTLVVYDVGLRRETARVRNSKDQEEPGDLCGSPDKVNQVKEESQETAVGVSWNFKDNPADEHDDLECKHRLQLVSINALIAYVRKLTTMLSAHEAYDRYKRDRKVDVPHPFENIVGENVGVVEALCILLDVFCNEEDERYADADTENEPDQPVVMCVMCAHREQHKADQPQDKGKSDQFEGVVEFKLIYASGRVAVSFTHVEKFSKAHHEEVAE